MELIFSHQIMPKRFPLLGRYRLMLFALFLSIVSGRCGAVVAPLICPAEIAQESIHLVSPPASWTPYVASPLYLHSAGLSAGPPHKLASLVGMSTGRPGRSEQWSTTYVLAGAYPDGKWLECGYGEYNQVVLAKRLSDDVRACTVRYRKGEKAGQNAVTVVCD